ncbi:type II toxin-antitoxin system RelE/ParE family toxin [Carnimonas bestiolae]|uniref:type II toxin-antitoxin system RelE/ParE family toxin n=1 Tax=Carnimonas bestiolae TaxID=3402172 RepID=UPI003F4AD566
MSGTGGLRKIRVAAKGHGKSGGARVIYYHFISASQIAMLFIYPKNEQEDLTSEQRKILKTVIEHWR